MSRSLYGKKCNCKRTPSESVIASGDESRLVSVVIVPAERDRILQRDIWIGRILPPDEEVFEVDG